MRPQSGCARKNYEHVDVYLKGEFDNILVMRIPCDGEFREQKLMPCLAMCLGPEFALYCG